MKTKILILASLSTITMLSADQYGQSSCPNGNCPYQGQGSGQSYYQGNQQYSNQNQNPSYYQNNNQRYNDNQYNNQNQQNNSQDRNGYYNTPNQQQYSYQNSQSNGQNSMNNGQDRNGYNNPNQNYSYQNSQSNGQNSMNNSQNRNGNNNEKNVAYSNRANNSGYMNGNNATMTRHDEEIAKDVHDEVGSNWLSSGYPNVTFDVNNGTVNLRGTVKTQDEKTKLETAIKKIRGVKEVNSEISVDAASINNNKNKIASNDSKIKKAEANFPQDKATTDSDRLINSKIRNKLSGWFTNGYETITLNTSNGVVTITGFVEKTEDIQKINKDAKVDGVKNVNNNVSVQKK